MIDFLTDLRVIEELEEKVRVVNKIVFYNALPNFYGKITTKFFQRAKVIQSLENGCWVDVSWWES